MAIGRAGRRGETMSVIVKGMQMPSECRKCFAMDYGTMTGETYCKVNGKTLAESYRPIGFDGRPEWCPLVELPEKHGRLIDADAFAERIKSIIERQGYDDLTIGKFLTVGDVLNAVIADLKGMTLYGYEHTPTVIEAEGAEE